MENKKYFDLSGLEIAKETHVKLVVGPRSCGKTLGILDRIYRTQKTESYCISVYRFLASMKFDMWSYYQDIYKREDLAVMKHQNAVMRNGKIFSASAELSSILAYDGVSLHIENVIVYDDVFMFCRNDEEVKIIVDKMKTIFPFAHIWIAENPYVKETCRKYRSILKYSDVIPFDVESYKRFVNEIYGDKTDEEIDAEAERAFNEHEAEYGADGRLAQERGCSML